ncbi:hypothetical protein ACLKA7_001084 [Drosophila subpalustris]
MGVSLLPSPVSRLISSFVNVSSSIFPSKKLRTMNVPAGRTMCWAQCNRSGDPRPRSPTPPSAKHQHVDVINMAANLSLSPKSMFMSTYRATGNEMKCL